MSDVDTAGSLRHGHGQAMHGTRGLTVEGALRDDLADLDAAALWLGREGSEERTAVQTDALQLEPRSPEQEAFVGRVVRT